MLQDLRFALRMIRTHRWFCAAVVATLALGIGINTTVFTLVNAVLFKPPPIPGGERLVMTQGQHETDPRRREGISHPEFLEYRASSQAFADLQAVQHQQGTLSESGTPPERYRLAKVSSGLFGMIRTAPILGRDFTPADDQPGAEAVVILGHGVWQERYGGASDVVGRAVRVNGAPATVVGVMPEGFRFPNNEELWMPLVPDAVLAERTNRSLQLFGLLRPGVSVEAANHDVAVIAGRLAEAFPEPDHEFRPVVMSFHDAFNGGEIRLVFLMMLGAVAFVLLIACANVANMMLSRAISRRRELSVRAAMGASRGRLVRQLLVESVVLSCLGGACGLGLSLFGVHLFDRATQDVGKPYWVLFEMDWRAFTYFAALSVVSGIIFGLLPALRASRVDLNTALKDDTPGGGSRRGHRLAGALVVLQFALTVVLLAGAGAMMRGFFAAQALNAFVPAEHIFTARLQLPEGKGDRYEDGLKRRQFHEDLLADLATLPGVSHVATASHLPGMGANPRPIEIEARPNLDPKNPARAAMIVQTPDYLPAIGLPIVMGRGFDATDGDPGKEAAVVTREFATAFWPSTSALGQRFRFVDGETPGPWMTVVGICADIVQDPRATDAPPLFYITHRQQAWGWFSILVRTTNDPAVMAAPIRAAVQALDGDLPLFDVATLPGALERSRWFLVVFGTLFLIFALIGLLLASVGIYAVVAQSTARRTREIGIRMALGATTGGIMRLVLTRGLRQLGLGLVLGLGGAIGATHVLANGGLLYRTSPNDPLLFITIIVLLVVIGLFACWLPARRAAQVAPTVALRTDG